MLAHTSAHGDFRCSPCFHWPTRSGLTSGRFPGRRSAPPRQSPGSVYGPHLAALHCKPCHNPPGCFRCLGRRFLSRPSPSLLQRNTRLPVTASAPFQPSSPFTSPARLGASPSPHPGLSLEVLSDKHGDHNPRPPRLLASFPAHRLVADQAMSTLPTNKIIRRRLYTILIGPALTPATQTLNHCHDGEVSRQVAGWPCRR